MATNAPVTVPAARAEHLIHPPKVELFDQVAMTNTDPKGFVRVVDEYREYPAGLYLARPFATHPRLAYLESILLPGLGLRVSRWYGHPGIDLGYDFYLDIADVTAGPVWRTTDLYLDILVSTGVDQRVLDVDELLAALAAGLVSRDDAQRALERLHSTVDGIAAAGYDVDRWLAGHGIHIDWTGSNR